jgi:uncharacterized membrane protein (DUF485 family)
VRAAVVHIANGGTMADTTELTGETPYQRVERSDEFQALRRGFRRFVFPMTAFFLIWYFAYVLLASYAHDFMSARIGDSAITVGLLFGLGQFGTTFAITMIYVRWANNTLDPAADALRERVEGGDL